MCWAALARHKGAWWVEYPRYVSTRLSHVTLYLADSSYPLQTTTLFRRCRAKSNDLKTSKNVYLVTFSKNTGFPARMSWEKTQRNTLKAEISFAQPRNLITDLSKNEFLTWYGSDTVRYLGEFLQLLWMALQEKRQLNGGIGVINCENCLTWEYPVITWTWTGWQSLSGTSQRHLILMASMSNPRSCPGWVSTSFHWCLQTQGLGRASY